MNRGHLESNLRQRRGATRGRGRQQSFLECRHIFGYAIRRWPAESSFRQFHRAIVSCPIVERTQPVTMHQTQQFSGEAGICRDPFEPGTLRL